MYKGLVYLFGVLFFLNTAMANIMITEIMYDPECSDSYCEYVEIYNNDTNSVNITGWSIEDNGDEDFLEGNSDSILILGYSYALIVDGDSRVYSNYEIEEVTWIYTEDTAIGNGLSNSETILLKNEIGDVINNITYDSSGNGKSYSFFNNSWDFLEPSPGYGEFEISDYSKIKINEFLPNPSGEDDQPMPNGEWIELYNNGDSDLDLREFKFKDNIGEDYDVIITDITTESTIIKAKDYLVVYANGVSGFLNNNGFEKIELYDLNDNLIDSIDYDGSDESVSWSFTEGKWQKTSPTPGKENLDEKQSLESELEIETIYDLGDGAAEWGDIIRVKFYAYKGNVNDNVLWIWVEDKNDERVTKKSKFNVYDKFQNYTITYPIQIPDNCDSQFESGKGRIVISGFDKTDYKSLEIRETPECKNSTNSARVSLFEYELVEFPEEVNSEFTSKIKLKNNDEEELKVDLWGYVYSGNKQYVKEEQENLQSINLSSGEEKIIELDTKPIDLEEDKNYRFKVKILKEGRNTPYDITKEVKINSENVKKGLNDITGNVVYESKGVIAQRSAVFFFGGLMASLSVFMFWRKWN